MTRSSNLPALADSAQVLSRQLHNHLGLLCQLIGKQAGKLDTRFRAKLAAKKYDKRQLVALSTITLGSAARFWVKDQALAGFLEQAAYSGRRLAKLNLSPSAIAEALAEYDSLLEPLFQGLPAQEIANLRWVREQLQFCVMLALNNAYYEIREAEAAAFYELFRGEVQSRGLDDLYERFLRTLSHFTKADAARYVAFDASAQSWRVTKELDVEKPRELVKNSPALRRAMIKPHSSTSRTVVIDCGWKRSYQSVWSMPLVQNGRLSGAFQFGFKKTYDWLPREQELLSAAAERCVEAAEKAHLIEDLRAREEQVRELAEHMLQVEEMERRRISGELHDEAGQSLLFVRLQMEMIENAMPDSLHVLREKMKKARETTETTIAEIRRLIAALSPAALEQLGLPAALRQLVMRFKQWYPSNVKLRIGDLGQLPKKTEVVVYRLVQECFNNISKHSFAETVNISVDSTDGLLRLLVQDNGIGFNVTEATAKRESFGLAGMRERVVLLGGTFRVVSNPAKRGKQKAEELKSSKPKKAARSGTKIWIQLPVPREAIAA